MAFVRFFWIVYLFFKYRLDELIPKNFIPAWLFLFFKLNPFRLNKNSKNSGERLSEALEKAGPVFVKFGQILSTRPDLINDEIISELKKFQNNLKPFDSRVAKPVSYTHLTLPTRS